MLKWNKRDKKLSNRRRINQLDSQHKDKVKDKALDKWKEERQFKEDVEKFSEEMSNMLGRKGNEMD